MTDNEFSTRAFYARAMESDPNIIATWTDKDGNTVVIVLDDAEEALAPYATRALGVVFVKGGPFVAYDNIAWMRPAPGGVSVGHHAITAGTLGMWVRDKANGSTAILSNNHVLANINQSNPGDDILQPGAVDGGKRAGNTIARLTRFVQLHNGATVDCAIAEVRNPADVELKILDLGYCYGFGEPYLDEKIWKSGRTTELTRGTIIAIDAVVRVGYGPSKEYIINDCIVSTIESAPGDSGSALLDFASNRVVGLLFAGGGGYTIGCTASNVFRQLDIETIEPPEIERSFWLDLSHWQGEVDFAKIKAMGVRGVILKACQPGVGTDAKFVEYYNAARTVRLLVGAYIFVDPGYSAAAHWAAFEMAIGNRKLDIPPAMDCEQGRGQNKAVITACIQGLSEALAEWYGSLPLVYTSVSFWNENVLNFTNDKDHPLWIAYWSNTAFIPAVPNAWAGIEPVMWQYDVNDNGAWFGVGSKQVDTNLTFPSFERLLIDAPPPPPPPEMVILTITIEGQGSVIPANGQYAKNETIQLTAIPAAGWQFTMWSGDVISQANPLNLLMDTGKSITATFAEGNGGPKEFVHHKGRTLIANQNYRRVPTTSGNTPLGTMPKGTMIEIMEEVKDPAGNIWARIGYKEYAAILHNGTRYIHVIEEGEE